MARRTEISGGRGPGRHQIAAWVGMTPDLVLTIAREAGIAEPPDRRLVNYTAPRYLSHADRSLIVRKFVGDIEIDELATLVSRTRVQLLGVLRRMGLAYGRGGVHRAALREEIARVGADGATNMAIVPSWKSFPAPAPQQPEPFRPAERPDHTRRGRAHGRIESGRSGRPRIVRSPSPFYPERRAEGFMTAFLKIVGEKLEPNAAAHLSAVTHLVYFAAAKREPIMEKPSRGVPPILRECLGVLYVGGVSPLGCAHIVGVSRHVIARVFSNYLGPAEYGRSNRSAWPGDLRPGFDLAAIAQSFGAQNFVFKKCLSSGLLFPVKRSEVTRRHLAPHCVARGSGGIVL